jgi:hypothetical protein
MTMTPYPFIRLTVRHGRQASWLVGGLAGILSILAFAQSQSIWVLTLGCIGSIGLSIFLRLLSEIVEVVADALLPR